LLWTTLLTDSTMFELPGREYFSPMDYSYCYIVVALRCLPIFIFAQEIGGGGGDPNRYRIQEGVG